MEFNTELDPWKRIERNINIRAAQAKHEIARMATIAKLSIGRKDITVMLKDASDYMLDHMLVTREHNWQMEAKNVLDFGKYKKAVEELKQLNVQVRIRNLNTNPYVGWYIPEKLTFPKHDWVYSLEKPDETDPKR